jgi:hypothetical protein
MNESKHTPGPWRSTFRPCGKGLWNTRIVGPDGENILADTYTQFYGPGQVESGANARLIAAAPELLEVAEDLVGLWDEWLRYSEDLVEPLRRSIEMRVGQAQAAISKVKGGIV